MSRSTFSRKYLAARRRGPSSMHVWVEYNDEGVEHQRPRRKGKTTGDRRRREKARRSGKETVQAFSSDRFPVFRSREARVSACMFVVLFSLSLPLSLFLRLSVCLSRLSRTLDSPLLFRLERARARARARARGKVFYITLGLVRERGHGSLLISALTLWTYISRCSRYMYAYV